MKKLYEVTATVSRKGSNLTSHYIMKVKADNGITASFNACCRLQRLVQSSTAKGCKVSLEIEEVA